jgi:ABC transport system ATP-binding/permease protein
VGEGTTTPPDDGTIQVPLASSGSLLYSGRRVPVGSTGVTIGRGESADLQIAKERVSRSHAVVRPEDGGFVVQDLGSRNGTFLNGERLSDGPRPLQSGDTIVIGDEPLRFIGGQETRMASRQLPIVGTQVVTFDGERLTIGRDASNDVVLSHPNVSRFHAQAVMRDGTVELSDLGSRNGTRLDGEFVETASLEPGSEIGIGPFRLVFDGDTFVARDDEGALRMDARELTIDVKAKRILDGASLSIEPGEFVAIIGESGAGKSTLIKALAGVTRPTSGRVLINGEPVFTRVSDIGYVPQDEIVHGLLSVSEALGYAARLRLPPDASADEIRETIERVLEELSLEEQAQTRIESVSGGQRKRTGVATELLNRPSLLFLDEPTTGLDPGLESRMMALLRQLANNSRAVAVVTHATKNLALCDKVVVMGRGGHIAFMGTPDEALGFFSVSTFDDIYGALETKPVEEWRRRFEGGAASVTGAHTVADQVAMPAKVGKRARRQRRLATQTRVLTHRYLKLLVRDRRNLILLLGQVPVLAIAILSVFEGGLFEHPGNPSDALRLLFLIVTTSIWLGSIASAREIIKEKSVFLRESAVGTRLSAYLTSKAVVLFGLSTIQTLLLVAFIFAFQPLHDGIGTYAAVAAVLVLTGWVAVAMGLAVSAAVGSQDQATSFIPLVLIPQLLFAGSLVPVETMREPVQTLSALVFSRWSFAGTGSAIDANARIAEDPPFAQVSNFGPDFFDLPLETALLVLAAFLIGFLALTAFLLRRSLRV